MNARLLLLFLSLPALASAQRFYTIEEHGFKVSTFAAPLFPKRTALPELSQGSLDFSGYSVGLSVLIPKLESWYWQAGIQFSNFRETYQSGKLNPGTTTPDSLPDRFRQIDNFSFLDANFGFRYYLNPGKRLKFFIHPALAASYSLTARRLQTTVYGDGKIEEFKGEPEDVSLRKFNVGVHFGGGAELLLHPTAAMFVEPVFFQQFLPAMEKDGGTSRFYAWGIGGGFVFKL
ncbi:MAG: hypothetical protein AAB316_20345 [Bacteroidota bacterium]